MGHTRRWWVAVTAVAALAGCAASPSGPSAPLDQALTLAPGDRVPIVGTALAVEFEGVDGDSRCPADALCVLGGDGVVRITVHDRGRVHDYALHTGRVAPVRHDGMTIDLVELAPYPFSARTMAADEYRASLRIRC